jgi:hypothetical protein
MSIKHRHLTAVACIIMYTVLASTLTFAAPIPPESARTAAGTFLSTQSPVAAKPSATVPSDLRDTDGNLLGYVVTTSSGGYVVTSANTDIPPILAYSDNGTFPTDSDSDNPAWHLVAGLVADWKENLDSDVPEASAAKVAHLHEWDRYLSGNVPARKPSEEHAVWGPLLDTEWGQLDPFNKYCPIDPNTGERCKVGCGPIQTAQILNYWKYPTSINLNKENNSYASRQYGGQGLKNDEVVSTIDIPGEAEILDFTTFAELNDMLEDITYSGDEDETAAFCFATAIILRTSFSSWASSSSGHDYSKFGFEPVDKIDGWIEAEATALDNLKMGCPVGMSIVGYYTSGPNEGKYVGHFVVLDGFDAGRGMFHVNMGHAGDGDGWFLLPDMDANWAYFRGIGLVTVNIALELGTISGYISDAVTEEGIPGAEITILPINIHTTTDMDGAYSINLPPNLYSLEVKHTLYKNTTYPEIDVRGDKVDTVDITMKYETTAVEHDAEPLVFSLGANYPNPFNPTTTIPFTIAEDDFTTLVIYNLAGQKVRELVAGNMRSGAHTVVWDGQNDAGAAVASGVYLSRLEAGESEMVRRMVLVK